MSGIGRLRQRGGRRLGINRGISVGCNVEAASSSLHSAQLISGLRSVMLAGCVAVMWVKEVRSGKQVGPTVE